MKAKKPKNVESDDDSSSKVKKQVKNKVDKILEAVNSKDFKSGSDGYIEVRSLGAVEKLFESFNESQDKDEWKIVADRKELVEKIISLPTGPEEYDILRAKVWSMVNMLKYPVDKSATKLDNNFTLLRDKTFDIIKFVLARAEFKKHEKCGKNETNFMNCIKVCGTELRKKHNEKVRAYHKNTVNAKRNHRHSLRDEELLFSSIKKSADGSTQDNKTKEDENGGEEKEDQSEKKSADEEVLDETSEECQLTLVTMTI